jgi:hypothetical protein
MGHRQGEPHGHRGVNRIAAGSQNLDAGLGGVAFPRDHHGVPRAHRLRGPRGHAGRYQQHHSAAAGDYSAQIVGQPILAAAGFQPATTVPKTRAQREKAA